MDHTKTKELSPGMRLTLTLGDMGDLGECVASYGLQRLFVFGGIPGELVDAELIRISHNRISARVVTVLEPSPHRVEPPCPYFWPCTGCQWQHISYEHQLQLKHELVKACLDQQAGLKDIPVLPTLPSPQLYGYRNHARFTVGPHGLLGFVNRVTRRFVNVETCALMDPRINQTLDHLQGHCAETTQLSVRCGINTGDQLIQPTLVGNGISLKTGQTHYEETLGGRRFLIGSPSFFQVNTPQAEAMVAHILNRLSPTGQEVLVDTYAGVGTLAALMAPHVHQVIAIEESAAAIKDARINVQGLANVEIRQGRTEELLSTISPPPDVVLLDPPRSGCHPTAIAALEKLAPKQVFYVSCNPTTLARDLSLLAKGSFKVEEVLPVDLFPQTHHIECIAILSRMPDPGHP